MIEKKIIIEKDIDSFKRSMSHLNQTAIQLTGKTFNYYSEVIDLPKMQLSRITIGKASMFHGVSAKGRVSFIIQKHSTPIKVNGQTVTVGGLYIMPPNEEIIALYQHDLEGFFFSIEEDYFKSYCGEPLYHKILATSEPTRKGLLQNQNIENIKIEITKIIELTLLSHNNLSPTLILDIQQRIALLLKDIFQTPPKTIKNINTRKKIVDRALMLIAGSTDVHMSIPFIASHCYCSVRTLEYAFMSILSVSPKQYLSISRMNMIHKELSDSNNNILISNLIEKYGIINQGRFSKQYKIFFGEYPRETKMRNKP